MVYVYIIYIYIIFFHTKAKGIIMGLCKGIVEETMALSLFHSLSKCVGVAWQGLSEKYGKTNNLPWFRKADVLSKLPLGVIHHVQTSPFINTVNTN